MIWYANEDADKCTFLSIKPPLAVAVKCLLKQLTFDTILGSVFSG
jgi:hypothetical protein